jgi:hypothetical protein
MTKFKILITEICVKTVSDRIIQQRIVGLNSNANIAIKKKSNILYANESKNADELIQCTASVIDGFLAAVTGSVLLEPSVVLQPRSARVLGPGGR